MPRSSKPKRPRVDINDAVELTNLWPRLRIKIDALDERAKTLAVIARDVWERTEHLDKVVNTLLAKLQAATPPAPKRAYRKSERLILERVPKKQGGWAQDNMDPEIKDYIRNMPKRGRIKRPLKRKKPTRHKAQRSTVPKH